MDQPIDLDALADDLAEVMDDLGAFGELVEVKNQHYAPGNGQPAKLHFGWDNWNPEQRQFERERTGYDLILKSRQVGISTIEKLRDLQFALTNESAHVQVVTHDPKEKRKFFNTLRTWANHLHRIGVAPQLDADTVDYLLWNENGSSIHIVEAGSTESTADKRGRSGTIDRLHATEMAFWGAADATWTSLLGAIEHGSEVVIESTANGLGNLFHQKVIDLQQGGFKPYKFHFFPWFAHPGREADPDVYSDPPKTRRERLWEERQIRLGITPEQLAWWRKKVGAKDLDSILQEYPPTPEAAFQSGGDTWIEPEHIERVQADVRKPKLFAPLEYRGTKIAPLRVYRAPKKGEAFVIGSDPSEGAGSDEAAIVVLDHRTGETVASWDSNEVKPGLLGHVLAAIGRTYNYAAIGSERNVWRGGASSGGKETLKVLLQDERYPKRRVYHTDDGKAGWHTGSNTREVLFGDLAKAIEDGDATTPDAKTAKELASVELVNGRPEVPRKGKGRADDGLFVAWAIAWQMLSRMRLPGKVVAEPGGDELGSLGFRT